MHEKEKRRRRRNDLARVKNRARRIAKEKYPKNGFSMYSSNGEEVSNEEWIAHISVRAANNMCMCSCHMCCNPRHSPYNKGSRKLTFQEEKFLFVEDAGVAQW